MPNSAKIEGVNPLSRRAFLAGGTSLAGLALSGCTTTAFIPDRVPWPPRPRSYALMYGPLENEPFRVPAVDLKKVPEKYYRQRVAYQSGEKPGTIIVDTQNFYLYWIENETTAMRYGVGLGRAGFEWSGRARVGWKQEWPKWTPPAEMIAREPQLAKYSAANGGMEPGLDNPLGARALYIFQGSKDTLYRIHGSPEYWSIGKAVSSGCVRLMNRDIVDLYERVAPRSPIVVT